MVRVGVCLLCGYEAVENDVRNLTDHLENDHPFEYGPLRAGTSELREWLERNTRVEERAMRPGTNAWIERLYSRTMRTGIGAAAGDIEESE